MTSEKRSFKLSGPSHLTRVDWSNVDHQRCVVSSLVRGVDMLERDRQANRKGSKALASPWWESFGFRLHTPLIDDADNTIFGAIYELKPPSNSKHLTVLNRTPHYIIAFRGTLTKIDSIVRDVKLDYRIFTNKLHQESRFVDAMQTVRKTVAEFGNTNVWLAGHSLGAAIAMLVGKTMAKEGVFLESFLFNPPIISAPIEKIKDQNVRLGVRVAKSFLTAGATLAVKAINGNNQQQMDALQDLFVALTGWVPRLYVNPGDQICSEYIGYFDHRKKMEEMGVGCVERLATQNSLRGLLSAASGKECAELLHLIPSANLIVNLVPALDFKQAHELSQWWGRDLKLQSKGYNYK